MALKVTSWPRATESGVATMLATGSATTSNVAVTSGPKNDSNSTVCTPTRSAAGRPTPVMVTLKVPSGSGPSWRRRYRHPAGDSFQASTWSDGAYPVAVAITPDVMNSLNVRRWVLRVRCGSDVVGGAVPTRNVPVDTPSPALVKVVMYQPSGVEAEPVCTNVKPPLASVTMDVAENPGAVEVICTVTPGWNPEPVKVTPVVA